MGAFFSSTPSSPAGGGGTSTSRHFDTAVRNACWEKADKIPGRDPDRWRKDAVGNVVCKRLHGCYGCHCFDYDHILPLAKGGDSTAANCQLLQTRVKMLKLDKILEKDTLKTYSCDLKFTDKELDVVEMAVYGDVARSGHKCRCKTVAEVLGHFKPKDTTLACKLPHSNEKRHSFVWFLA